MNAELLVAWRCALGEAYLEDGVRHRVHKHVAAAFALKAELDDLDGFAAKEARFADAVRQRAVGTKDWTVVQASSDRMDEAMEAPDEAPPWKHYVAARVDRRALGRRASFAGNRGSHRTPPPRRRSPPGPPHSPSSSSWPSTSSASAPTLGSRRAARGFCSSR